MAGNNRNRLFRCTVKNTRIWKYEVRLHIPVNVLLKLHKNTLLNHILALYFIKIYPLLFVQQQIGVNILKTHDIYAEAGGTCVRKMQEIVKKNRVRHICSHYDGSGGALYALGVELFQQERDKHCVGPRSCTQTQENKGEILLSL